MDVADIDSADTAEPSRKPLREQVLGGYWRVPAFGLVAALAAFLVSFAFPSEYSAVSRLIIRTGETSYSTTDSGATVGDGINIGGIDLTKQQTLGNTLTNLTQSHESAEEIVDRIGIERINGGEAPTPGTTSKVVNFFKVGGAGTAPSAEQAAVEKVQGSIEAVVLDESWIMEITAWDTDPGLARDIADAAADVTVDQSAERFAENSRRELEFLEGELETAGAALDGLTVEVSDARAEFERTAAAAAEGEPGPDVAAARQTLAPIEREYELADAAYAALTTRYRVVEAMVNKPRFDASRLGDAVPSTSPGRPLRYLFLLVGGLVGALAGLLLTWFRSVDEQREREGRREEETDGGGPAEQDPDRVVDVREPTPSTVRSGNGAALSTRASGPPGEVT
jgi:uncharacterized protein involved in exopolysaccharide biosynthesis